MLIETAKLDQALLDPEQQHQVYCGLDSMLTTEILSSIKSQHSDLGEPIYSFERALQAPLLEMSLHGFAIDGIQRHKMELITKKHIEESRRVLNELAFAVWDKELNPRSHPQLCELFYKRMKIPEIWLSFKGERRLSMNREALEKIDEYMYARPFVSLILSCRKLYKQLDVLTEEIDEDGRHRTSYNIGGTETGRLSSSTSVLGTGGNAQNIAPELRRVFVADTGYKLCSIDLEQVEARDVGFLCGSLFGDWSLLDSCELGDLHTNNCKLIWPELSWPKDAPSARAMAERTPIYREWTMRDLSKRGGHLCLTGDHEVLTPQGWVSITEKPPVIMQFRKHSSEWANVTNWVDEPYSGDMHEFEGNSISSCMTPNHRMPFKRDQRTPNFEIKKAEDGPGAYIPLGWGWKGGHKIVPARLIAAFMSDGHQKSTGVVEFHLKKVRKIERLHDLCSQYGFHFYTNISRDKYYVEAANWPKECGSFMFDWTKECLSDFLDEYKYWDGHISKTAISVGSINRKHLEWIQTFDRIMGIGGQINTVTTHTTFGRSGIEYTTKYYRLGQNNRKYANGHSIKHTKQHMNCRVYCPTVPSTLFYVRRNGRVFVTGNTNYNGTAWTMSRVLKIPLNVAVEFQARYCRGASNINPAYPCVRQYWNWIASQLQTEGSITTCFGRQRHFFGDRRSDATLREAIAYVPQSMTADRTNLWLWKVWARLGKKIQLLAQTHDSITFQFLESENQEEIISGVLSLLSEIYLTDPKSGRRYIVPGEAKVGWNWASYSPANPGGLRKWKPGAEDNRTRPSSLSLPL
jgi:hypothetical protein